MTTPRTAMVMLFPRKKWPPAAAGRDRKSVCVRVWHDELFYYSLIQLKDTRSHIITAGSSKWVVRAGHVITTYTFCQLTFNSATVVPLPSRYYLGGGSCARIAHFIKRHPLLVSWAESFSSLFHILATHLLWGYPQISHIISPFFSFLHFILSPKHNQALK